MSHPNKAPFKGILTRVDEVSDKSASGARGHKVFLTRDAAMNALPTLVGMGVNLSPDGQKHFAAHKHGVIEQAEIVGNDIVVYGYMFRLDCKHVIQTIQSSAQEWGMSYELHESHVRDMRTEVYVLEKVTFTGACVLLREKAAYSATSFVLMGDD